MIPSSVRNFWSCSLQAAASRICTTCLTMHCNGSMQSLRITKSYPFASKVYERQLCLAAVPAHWYLWLETRQLSNGSGVASIGVLARGSGNLSSSGRDSRGLDGEVSLCNHAVCSSGHLFACLPNGESAGQQLLRCLPFRLHSAQFYLCYSLHECFRCVNHS